MKVADHAVQTPGSTSWSPEGKSIAFISDAIVIFDLESKYKRKVSVLDPYFLCWGTDNVLYVLHRTESGKVLSRIDPDTLNRTEIQLPIQPEGIFALPQEKNLLLVTAALDLKRLWSDISYALYIFDPNTLSPKKIYESRRTLKRHKGTLEYLSGWLWAGPQPGDSTFMTMEPVNPPVVMPYLQLGMVDYLTGKSVVIGRIDNPALSIPASWSPDGRRFAFSDQEGLLHLYDIKQAAISTPEKNQSIRGNFPAWNPQGSQIYFGGHIIRSDGHQTEVLGPEGQDNIGFWSSDGTKIAIAAKSGLYIADNYKPLLVAPDVVYTKEKTAKLRLLKELLAEGLISEHEYGTRHDHLMKNTE